MNSFDATFRCTTCETGNILIKIFAQDMTVCKFACLEGYVRVCGDCVLGVSEVNEFTFSNHSLNVTYVRWDRQLNNSGNCSFVVTVSHTAYGHLWLLLWG